MVALERLSESSLDRLSESSNWEHPTVEARRLIPEDMVPTLAQRINPKHSFRPRSSPSTKVNDAAADPCSPTFDARGDDAAFPTRAVDAAARTTRGAAPQALASAFQLVDDDVVAAIWAPDTFPRRAAFARHLVDDDGDDVVSVIWAPGQRPIADDALTARRISTPDGDSAAPHGDARTPEAAWRAARTLTDESLLDDAAADDDSEFGIYSWPNVRRFSLLIDRSDTPDSNWLCSGAFACGEIFEPPDEPMALEFRII
ncbi:hypothetical protein M885DRAFT_614900 [Pelagophyceae sp. CCMP2097]|nr:hypothetical protein M885DRAFT_614900 [Pelagophyceae sp. CCMP2097]|mmetsp:Transcript_19887/g.67317  ORF Transcript_19887/g.67317 Transcript_19887/m.67317 type:complete len:258 (+) Transcript_19887:87-860(+)